MQTMKCGTGRARPSSGALQAVATLKPAVNVVGCLSLTENTPGGQTQRPSDIITIFGGKTARC